MSERANCLQITATIVAREELRYTPAGIPVFVGNFHYSGDVYEAGAMRHLEFDFTGMSFAETAVSLQKAQIGAEVTLKGFIATRSLRSQRLTVHVTEFTI